MRVEDSVQEQPGGARDWSQPGETAADQTTEECRHLRIQHGHLAGRDSLHRPRGKYQHLTIAADQYVDSLQTFNVTSAEVDVFLILLYILVTCGASPCLYFIGMR